MSNVKPGDFARIVQPRAGNAYGKVVHVKRAADNKRIPLALLVMWGAQWWECTTMSAMMARKITVSGERGERFLAAPGRMMPIPDVHLRRIDPPEEPDEDDNEQEHEADKVVTA